MPVRLEGMVELMRQIEEVGKTLDRETKRKALTVGAEFMKDKVKAQIDHRFPTGTGHLRDSISVSDIDNDEINIGPEQMTFYGRFLEFGTSKMSPIPFMGPTFESNKRTVQEKMKDVIKSELGL